MNNGWDQFAKYVGVQGIMALALVGGYIYMTVNHIEVSDPYSQIMTLVLGYYFAKNGVGILEKFAELLRGPAQSKTGKR